MTNHLPFQQEELDPYVVKKIINEALEHLVKVELAKDQKMQK